MSSVFLLRESKCFFRASSEYCRFWDFLQKNLFYNKNLRTFSEKKAMESSSYAGSKFEAMFFFCLAHLSKGVFQGWWKMRHLPSFPENFQHEEFFQAFGKVGGFWSNEKNSNYDWYQQKSGKPIDSDWYYGHVFNCWTNSCWWTKF